jgi:hypothetical protein
MIEHLDGATEIQAMLREIGLALALVPLEPHAAMKRAASTAASLWQPPSAARAAARAVPGVSCLDISAYAGPPEESRHAALGAQPKSTLAPSRASIVKRKGADP